ncbi:serine protease inhibitor 77Ba-like [Anthonomus grandis grandis]|uniref:serine protease inhibitor 77Ba-like n=1 Tax=Anthonomus grandis grandis TaxID=2921223 RepID=UPI0021664815|nr:serine protease inhibitor 77Ba-like [Anthonomus grandis grandis]
MGINYLALATVICLSTPAQSQGKFNIAESINKFSVKLLWNANKVTGSNVNVALSPLTIWTVLTIVSEGAYDNTADQIDKALGQNQNKNVIREAYYRLAQLMDKSEKSEAEFDMATGIFARKQFPVKRNFANVVKQYYDASVTPVDFVNGNAAADLINKYVAKATRNRITQLVTAGDVQDAYLFMLSTTFFKGSWQQPFNTSKTRREAFLDDKRKPIGEVDLMFNSFPYPYSKIDNIKADALELPYGANGDYSMLVLVPRGAQSLANMLESLNDEPVLNILSKIRASHDTYPEDNIYTYLPKFKITSNFNMDMILQMMGITDVFDPQKANLLGMFSHYLYLSRVIQRAEIEVNEEGTVASAASGFIFPNRITPPTVKVNRPFAYFIVHRETGSILFCGKISDPRTL